MKCTKSKEKVIILKEEQNRLEQNHLINIVKFLMSISVVAIHTKPLLYNNIPIVGNIYNSVLLLAVPFFFMTSGFLIFNQMQMPYYTQSNLKAILRHIVKLLKYYLAWSLLYLPISIFGFHMEGVSYLKALVLYLRNLLLQGENFYSYPLWYLLSSIYGFMLLYLMVKKGKTSIKAILFVIVMFFVLSDVVNAIVFNDLSQFSNLNYISVVLEKTIAQGRIFSGISLIFIGTLVSKYYYLIAKCKFWNILFVISFMLMSFINQDLFRWITCILFFLLILSYENSVKCIRNTKYYRRMSTVIYYVHMWVFFIYTVCVGFENQYGIMGFVFTLVGSFLLGIVINSPKLKSRKAVVFLFGKL